MRTLQEKYNAIQEGKFSKDQFLRDARLEQPNLVTQYNGYDDAVKILKNRGMIQEAASTEEAYAEYSDDALTDMIINLSRFSGNADIIARVKAELARRKRGMSEISSDTFKRAVDVARGRGEDKRASRMGSAFLNSFVGKPLMGGKISRIDIQKPSFGDYFDVTLEVLIPTQGTQGMYDKPKYLYYDIENDEWNLKGKGLEITRSDARVLSQIATKVNPDTKYSRGVEHFDIKGFNEGSLNEARLTKNNLADYRYKPTNDMDKYPYEQILRGLRVELEGLQVLGTPTPEEYKKALAKVLKNLEKDSIFYTNQVAGVKAKAKRTDVMVDATAKNEVDKENGLQKAALKEAIKGVIKNILSEDLDPDLYDQDEERQERKSRYGQSEFGDGEDIYEMQGPKSDQEYKSELADYLEDNQIYGYTDRLFDILTDPAEETVADKLADFLDDNQIYGYNKGLLAIFRDYANNNERQYIPDEDEIDYDDENFSDPLIDGEDDLFESIDGKVEKAIKKIVAKFINTFGEISDETRQEFEEAIKYDYEDDPKGILKMDLDDAVQIFDASGLQLVDEEGLDEATDKEADKDMVRKLMRMYETEPSKFERLHKQAETQAATSKDIKFKHLLSLLNRAKAGALQSLANQDRFEADREGMYESVSLFDILDEGSSKHSTEWFKGYRAFNDDKKLSDNPYKESPKKEDWAAGWDQAQSHASDAYKGY